jgi:hypothetical protein
MTLFNSSFSRKMKKLCRTPSLYFYDLFRKRLLRAGSLPDSALPYADQLQYDAYGPLPDATFQDLLAHYQCRTGALTGYADHSLLLKAPLVPHFTNSLLTFACLNAATVRLFTPDGSLFTSDLRLNKYNTPSDRSALIASLMRSADFVIEIDAPRSPTSVYQVFLYDTISANTVTLRTEHAFIKKISTDAFEAAFPLVATSSDRRPTHLPDVDVVYTYVDRNDPSWQQQWGAVFGGADYDPDRYHSRDELRFSLRALFKYAPWIRNVYVVSNCAPPSYISSSGNITWIPHTQIFPDQEDLPTFNSHAIEACLHRVPGLAEHFLYLNDDVFINRPLYYQDVFDHNNNPRVFLESYGMIPDALDADTPDYLRASFNSRQVLQNLFPQYTSRQLHKHVVFSHRRSLLEELEAKAPEPFRRTRQAKTRTCEDVNVTSFLAPHYYLATSRATASSCKSLIVRPQSLGRLNLKNRDCTYDFLCFNDGGGTTEDTAFDTLFRWYRERRCAGAFPDEICDADGF